MAEGDQKDRLRQLGERIKAAKGDRDKPHMEEHYSQAQVGWRMVTELVAGIGIGFGIGYGLDALFGTLPWLMVLFTMFGFVAGVKTMMRTAKEIEVTQDLSHLPVVEDDEDERD